MLKLTATRILPHGKSNWKISAISNFPKKNLFLKRFLQEKKIFFFRKSSNFEVFFWLWKNYRRPTEIIWRCFRHVWCISNISGSWFHVTIFFQEIISPEIHAFFRNKNFSQRAIVTKYQEKIGGSRSPKRFSDSR